MTFWFDFTIATVALSWLAYLGLMIWAWRTPNGLVWRIFSLVATFDFTRTTGWVSLLMRYPDRYLYPTSDLKLTIVSQFLCAICTFALALALRRAQQARRGDRP